MISDSVRVKDYLEKDRRSELGPGKHQSPAVPEKWTLIQCRIKITYKILVQLDLLYRDIIILSSTWLFNTSLLHFVRDYDILAIIQIIYNIF